MSSWLVFDYFTEREDGNLYQNTLNREDLYNQTWEVNKVHAKDVAAQEEDEKDGARERDPRDFASKFIQICDEEGKAQYGGSHNPLERESNGHASKSTQSSSSTPSDSGYESSSNPDAAQKAGASSA